MATTENLHTGDGSKTKFSFTFPYLNQTDVEVYKYVTNAWVKQTITTHYKKHLKNHGQDKFPVGKTFIHTELTKIHNRAFKLAWKELQLARKSTRPRNLLESFKYRQIEKGDTQEALTTQQQIDELIRLQKPLN